MQAKYKWLLLAPALAVALLFGPLRQPAPANSGAPPAGTVAAPAADQAGGGSALPASPSIGEVASTLVGVLLLGVAAVLALSRFSRRTRGGATGAPLALRQSLRLSGKHAVHVVQFEDRLLLIGDRDGSLSLLKEIADEAVRADDAEVARRAEEVADDGAVPRNLVIPRPERPVPPAQRSRPRQRPAAAEQLTDEFRALLKRARAKAQAR